MQLKTNLFDVQVKQLDSSLWGTRQGANELVDDDYLGCSPCGPMAPGRTKACKPSPFVVTWRNTSGAEGEEPPAEVKNRGGWPTSAISCAFT